VIISLNSIKQLICVLAKFTDWFLQCYSHELRLERSIDTRISGDCIASSDKGMINSELGNDIQGSGRGLVWGTVPTFAWMHWWKPRNPSVRIDGPRAWIWTRYLSYMKQECLPFDRDVQRFIDWLVGCSIYRSIGRQTTLAEYCVSVIVLETVWGLSRNARCLHFQLSRALVQTPAKECSLTSAPVLVMVMLPPI
jgi:hypothetical protein